MKKLVLTLGLACLFMVACNNAPKQQEAEEATPVEVVEEEHHCPLCPLKAEFANWDQMEETAKVELIAKAMNVFAEMEANKPEMPAEGEAHACCNHEGEEGHQCNHEGEEGHQCQHMEMTEEQKAECEAKHAEMEAKWADFANLTLDEQKDLILAKIDCIKKHMGGEHQCNHAEAPAETPAE